MLAWSVALAQTPTRVPVNCNIELVRQLDLDCSPDEPCPLYLELSDVELVGERIVVAGNIHTTDSTLESVLLISEDSGKTWNEGLARVPAGSLTEIQFLDFEFGWVGGHVLRPDARDPFFLLSSDGGKTWRRRPVYSEPKSGLIEQFKFDSRTSGKMLIDRGQGGENGLRYEMWESFTGGDSWNVKQVDSKPIPFPGTTKPGEKTLRLRADAPSKTYKIERSEANRWRVIASFAVSLGECKPEPPEAKEPEPPPAEPEAPPKPAQKNPPSLKGKSK